MPHLRPVATWAISTFPSVRAKAIIRKHVPMRVMCRRHMIASIQPQTVVTWHASSSMPMSFPKTASPKGCIVRCTMRHGIRLMGQIMGSTGEMIGIPCPGLIATRLSMFPTLLGHQVRRLPPFHQQQRYRRR